LTLREKKSDLDCGSVLLINSEERKIAENVQCINKTDPDACNKPGNKFDRIEAKLHGNISMRETEPLGDVIALLSLHVIGRLLSAHDDVSDTKAQRSSSYRFR
jgi:hypothetical protein